MSFFTEKSRELSAMFPRAQFEDHEVGQVGAGRQIAAELATALRAGDRTPDLLLCAATLAGQSGDVLLRGFFRGLEDALRQSPTPTPTLQKDDS